MAEYNAPASLITPGGTITFNGDTPPAYLHDQSVCAGLDGAPARTTVDPKSVTDGGIWHRSFKAAREVTIGGVFVIDAVTDAVTLEDNLLAACDSIFGDPGVTGTYQWMPSDGSTRSITVRCDILPTFSGPAYQKKYTFGLVAIDPTVTVA